MDINNVSGSRLNDQERTLAASGLDALEQTLRQIADRSGMHSSSDDPVETPESLAPPKLSLTSTGIGKSGKGSVFHLSAPLPRNIRFHNSTVAGPEITPISSPVFAGFMHSEDYERGRRAGESESRERFDEEIQGLLNPGVKEVVSRLEEVQEFYNEAFPNETGRILGAREVGSSDDPDYFRYSQEHQVSSQHRETPGRVPERFQAGRESLSVTRNITVRDSKRPKARSQDKDYKRRFSSSGPIHNLPLHGSDGSSGGGIQAQYHSFHAQGQSPTKNFQSHLNLRSENVQPHHPPHYLNPALRVNNGMNLETDIESQGFANRERRVADGTFPPSSTGNVEDGGIQRTQVRSSASSNEGVGGDFSAGRIGSTSSETWTRYAGCRKRSTRNL